jgi:hypothetical protein
MAEHHGQSVHEHRNDIARHEAFSELYNLNITRKEEFVVPEVVLVGTRRLPGQAQLLLFSLPIDTGFWLLQEAIWKRDRAFYKVFWESS